MEIDEFNGLDAADARAVVYTWAAVPRWAEGVIARRPYASAEELAEIAQWLTRSWTATELAAGLAHHPRIGERPTGTGAAAEASRSEQSSMTSATDDTAARIAAGNIAYESRFGRVFLIRAAGRTPDEILAQLERRLQNDDATERREATEQLAEIAVLRLRGAVRDRVGTRITT